MQARRCCKPCSQSVVVSWIGAVPSGKWLTLAFVGGVHISARDGPLPPAFAATRDAAARAPWPPRAPQAPGARLAALRQPRSPGAPEGGGGESRKEEEEEEEGERGGLSLPRPPSLEGWARPHGQKQQPTAAATTTKNRPRRAGAARARAAPPPPGHVQEGRRLTWAWSRG
ncbi:unnamed protein product [Prorocentrum cordatum]|uniref:Uncharacterized protein n=1 Tax=Prorocentrum cordatum TaxID=2364126 RepID=A0ABN9SM19_9DINO|nr:unnamed protein product [Polarella glacialis]